MVEEYTEGVRKKILLFTQKLIIFVPYVNFCKKHSSMIFATLFNTIVLLIQGILICSICIVNAYGMTA